MAQSTEFGPTQCRREKLMRKTKQGRITDTSSSPISDLTEDILIEILLLCFPDAESAVQCSLVCKNWHSLIFSDLFRTVFNKRQCLKDYNDPSYSPPFTLLFTSLLHQDDMILSKSADGINYHPNSSIYLDFLPQDLRDHESMRVASSGELLLSARRNSPKFCISNPVKRQWNILPDMSPTIDYGAIGLWQGPNRRTGYHESLGSYKIVIFDDAVSFIVTERNYTFKTLVFCSETQMWSRRNFTVPMASVSTDLTETKAYLEPAVASNGVLYFPMVVGEHNYVVGFLVCDPNASSDECRVVDMPFGFGFGFGWKSAFYLRVGVGVVRGKLRLWQMLKSHGCFELRVWELCDETVWDLVHDVRLIRNRRKTYVSVVALDPNDVDVVYTVQNTCIWKYNIRHEKYEKIGQIPKVKRMELEKKYVLWNFLTILPIVHTSCHLLPM